MILTFIRGASKFFIFYKLVPKGLLKVGFTEGYDEDLKKWFNAASSFVKIILQRCQFFQNNKGLKCFF